MRLEIPFNFHESWYSHMVSMFNSDYMKSLNMFLASKDYLPHRENIFRAFNMPLDQIRVVILGQDPYPTPGHANGLAFAVNSDVKKPRSMKIIEDELRRTYGPEYEIDRTLKRWADQGVLMLNCALTVEPKHAGCHIENWKKFTQHVLNVILDSNTALVFMVWGKSVAYKHIQAIKPEKLEPHLILYSPHPAAELYKPGIGFIGNNHFEITNEHYKKVNNLFINW